MKALIIDDDERLSQALGEYLEGRGVSLQMSYSLSEGRAALARSDFDAIILDVMLPDGDGMEFCHELNQQGIGPILMLSARGETTDRIVGLEMGADDYLAKPFDPAELAARLKAITRRGAGQADTRSLRPLRFEDLEIDRRARRVRLRGHDCPMTSYQFDLLVELATNAGTVISRERLMSRVRGETLGPYDRSIDIQISRLRAAIEEDSKKPRRILTIRGAGYLFVSDPDE